MEFHGQIQNGRIQLPDAQNELRERFLSSLKDGQLIKETIVKSDTSKTHQQIKAIFGLAMVRICDEMDSRGWDSSVILGNKIPTGVAVSKGLLKEYLYIVCPICDDSGNKVTLSSASTSIPQAAKFFEDIRAWSASQWQIDIPEPQKNWKEIKTD
jgi:hypothetical protein